MGTRMVSITLCDGDPVVEYLRSTFGANIVRIPRASIQPLSVLAVTRGGTAKDMGRLADIVAPASGSESGFAIGSEDIHDEVAPPVLGSRTGSVGVKLGVTILGGLLQALGTSKAGLSAAFEQNSSISFTFHDVHRVYIETNRLGRALQNGAIDTASPATALYFRADDPARLLVVDSVLTSSGFTVTASRSNGESASVDVPLLQQLVSDGSASVSFHSATSSQVSFDGPQPLTFAFTCLAVSLDDDGRIVGLEGDTHRTIVQGVAASEAAARLPATVSGMLLTEDPALLDLDDADGTSPAS
jgi:hypothetical protein